MTSYPLFIFQFLASGHPFHEEYLSHLSDVAARSKLKRKSLMRSNPIFHRVMEVRGVKNFNLEVSFVSMDTNKLFQLMERSNNFSEFSAIILFLDKEGVDMNKIKRIEIPTIIFVRGDFVPDFRENFIIYRLTRNEFAEFERHLISGLKELGLFKRIFETEGLL